MDKQSKEMLLEILSERISEANHLAMTGQGKSAEKYRSKKETLVALKDYLAAEPEKDTLEKGIIKLNIPLDCKPELERAVQDAIEKLSKEKTLEAKKRMFKLLRVQIALMGGKDEN